MKRIILLLYRLDYFIRMKHQKREDSMSNASTISSAINHFTYSICIHRRYLKFNNDINELCSHFSCIMMGTLIEVAGYFFSQ